MGPNLGPKKQQKKNTDNICFGLEIRKIIFCYALVTKGLLKKQLTFKLKIDDIFLSIIMNTLCILGCRIARFTLIFFLDHAQILTRRGIVLHPKFIKEMPEASPYPLTAINYHCFY